MVAIVVKVIYLLSSILWSQEFNIHLHFQSRCHALISDKNIVHVSRFQSVILMHVQGETEIGILAGLIRLPYFGLFEVLEALLLFLQILKWAILVPLPYIEDCHFPK